MFHDSLPWISTCRVMLGTPDTASFVKYFYIMDSLDPFNFFINLNETGIKIFHEIIELILFVLNMFLYF